MKTYLLCSECLRENESLKDASWYSFPYNDEGVYKFTCMRGHDNSTLLSDLKFQSLFEIGANAIVDGYFREAVSSFSSS